MSVQTVFLPGLSPLARGTPLTPIRQTVEKRFIPAGAGNTLNGGEKPPLNSVYPRWRGEHKKAIFLFDYTGGLSPLARGTQCIS